MKGISSKEVMKSLRIIEGEYKKTVPDDKKESKAIDWGIQVMKQARGYIIQRDQAIELLKEFAFHCVDLSTQEHCNQAEKVQKFLRDAGFGKWIDDQIVQNQADVE